MGEYDVEAHALNNVGAAVLLGSDLVEGLARLRQSLDLALAHDLHEHAARAYTNIGSGLAALRSYPEADVELTAGIAYCADRDLDAWWTYMTAWLAHSSCQQGRYTEALGLAETVLRRPGQSPVSRIPALVVAGTIVLRRADPGADVLLDEARDLAARPARPSASCRLPWPGRRPPGCGATGKPWRVSSPLPGGRAGQIFAATRQGRAGVVAP